MGRDFGELGKARPRDDTFGWFGNQIRVGRQSISLQTIDLMEKSEAVGDDDLAQMRVIREFFHNIVHEDDWAMFWQAALDNGQEVPDLMELIQTLAGKATDRFTRRRSASSSGRRGTAARSRAGSSSVVRRRLEKRGRADLALIVDRATQSTG